MDVSWFWGEKIILLECELLPCIIPMPITENTQDILLQRTESQVMLQLLNYFFIFLNKIFYLLVSYPLFF